MVVNRYLEPPDEGRGPKISTCMWSNLLEGGVELADAGLSMTGDFARLAGDACPGPGFGVLINGVPHEVLAEEFGGSSAGWVSEVVYCVKTFLSECFRDPGPRCWCGGVAQQRGAVRKLDFLELKRRGSLVGLLRLLLLREVVEINSSVGQGDAVAR